MALHQRLQRLERAALPPTPVGCHDCGGGGPGPHQVRLVPIPLPSIRGEPRPEPVRSARPEVCPRCGRRLVVRLLPITLDEKW